MTASDQSPPDRGAGRPYAENDGFARVALAERYCTQLQIDRCLHIQSKTDERLSLGQSLLREGFVTQEQYSRVLVLLRKGYKEERDTAVVLEVERRREENRTRARQSQEDRLLAKILAAEGLVDAETLKLDLEEATKSLRPLAEVLVTLGHMDYARIERILNRLERRELSCPACGATLCVLRVPTAAPVQCPRCQIALAPGRT
jgi:hypothetical protein